MLSRNFNQLEIVWPKRTIERFTAQYMKYQEIMTAIFKVIEKKKLIDFFEIFNTLMMWHAFAHMIQKFEILYVPFRSVQRKAIS